MRQNETQAVLDEHQYKTIVESAPNMIWRAGTDGLCNYFNSTWLHYTGQDMAHELGDGWAEGVHPEDVDRCMGIYMAAFEMKEPFEMIYRIKRYDGEYRWIHDKGTPYYNDSGAFGGYIGSCLDVNEQITGETWKSLAQKDGLTGVLNRSFFDQEANRLYNAAQLHGNSLLAVMLDIDNFKYINDHFGHPFGDKMLKAFSDILTENTRKSDLLGRYGGDEFVLLLPETDLSEAEKLITRIEARVKQRLDAAILNGLSLTFSYGIAELRSDEPYDALVERADCSMYMEKNQKKNLS